MKLVLIAILLGGTATSALAGIYDITLRRVAASGEFGICENIADELATAFSEQTDATIIDYGCRDGDMSFEGIEAVLTYQAPERLAVTSNYGFPIVSAAFYRDRDACLQQLELQRQLFESATGLPSLISYCMRDGSLSPKWLSRVEGLGTSAIRADNAYVSFSGDLLNESQIIADYQLAADGFGLTIFEAGIAFGGIGRNLVLRLYADDAYSIDDYDEMTYDTPEQCLDSADMVRGILAQATDPVVIFCEQRRNGQRSTLHATTFNKTLEYNQNFAARVLTGDFSSLAECQAASEAIDDSASDVFGAVCSGSSDNYSIHLFYRP